MGVLLLGGVFPVDSLMGPYELRHGFLTLTIQLTLNAHKFLCVLCFHPLLDSLAKQICNRFTRDLTPGRQVVTYLLRKPCSCYRHGRTPLFLFFGHNTSPETCRCVTYIGVSHIPANHHYSNTELYERNLFFVPIGGLVPLALKTEKKGVRPMERPVHSPSKSPLDAEDLEVYVLKVEDVLTMIHYEITVKRAEEVGNDEVAKVDAPVV